MYPIEPRTQEIDSNNDFLSKFPTVQRNGILLTKYKIKTSRQEDFSQWYLEIIKEAGLVDDTSVHGCMVIKPWECGWKNIKNYLNIEFKKLDVEHGYYQLFTPLYFFSKEAAHVNGFAQECADKIKKPLSERPTTETRMANSFKNWIDSYRDLPFMINRWADVDSWYETKPFVPITEFLLQENRTAHATKDEAIKKAQEIAKIYQNFIENVLAIPLFVGEKSAGECLAGAVNCYTFEAMMQDGKALQLGTSNYLGQNFSQHFDITFLDKTGNQQLLHTTSSGLTNRLIGALVMVHSDEAGLRLPPRICIKQVVIIPIIRKGNDTEKKHVDTYVEDLAQTIQQIIFEGEAISVELDKRDIKLAEKRRDWTTKGVPIRIEVGWRESQADYLDIDRRDSNLGERLQKNNLSNSLVETLKKIQDNYYNEAKSFRDAHVYRNLTTFEELRQFFTSRKPSDPYGFVIAKWCGDPETEAELKKFQVTIRCIPFEQTKTEGKCIITGKPATLDAVFAKSY